MALLSRGKTSINTVGTTGYLNTKRKKKAIVNNATMNMGIQIALKPRFQSLRHKPRTGMAGAQ